MQRFDDCQSQAPVETVQVATLNLLHAALGSWTHLGISTAMGVFHVVPIGSHPHTSSL